MRGATILAAIRRRLAFDADIMVCGGRDVLRLLAWDWFAGQLRRRDVVRFVTVLARAPRRGPPAPLALPARGPWLVRVLAREGRFVVGVHRRQMQAIAQLGMLDQLYGVRGTTRSWTTIAAVANELGRG